MPNLVCVWKISDNSHLLVIFEYKWAAASDLESEAFCPLQLDDRSSGAPDHFHYRDDHQVPAFCTRAGYESPHADQAFSVFYIYLNFHLWKLKLKLNFIK